MMLHASPRADVGVGVGVDVGVELLVGVELDEDADADADGYGYGNDSALALAIHCGSMECRGWLHLGVTMFILGLEIIWTVAGNLLVVIAILHEKHLRVPGNYLIFNLAFADLLVGMLVMPISAVREVSSHWIFGKVICEIHCHLDVLCCTSSILTLLAIAWDRSLTVRNINYILQRTQKRMLTTIAIVWFVAFCITIPQAIIKYLLQQRGGDTSDTCEVPQDWYYQLYATSCSFYIPLVLIITLYIRIYKTARSTIRKDKFRKKKEAKAGNVPEAEHDKLLAAAAGADGHAQDNGAELKPGLTENNLEMGTTYCRTEMQTAVHDVAPEQESSRASSEAQDAQDVQKHALTLQLSNDTKKNGKKNDHLPVKSEHSGGLQQKHHHRLEQKREKKAARVLLIVTGTFVACWLPFFLTALITSVCGEACKFTYQPLLLSIVLWLGYTCSAFNPVIYTIFSPDFRHAFQKILHLQRSA